MTDSSKIARALAEQTVRDVQEFRKHPYFAISKGWVLTQDEHPPEGVPAVRPMPAAPYLKVLTDLWLESPLMILCKSRQMMASWWIAWLTLWWALTHEGAHGLFQGKRQEDVSASGTKGLLGRARFIREHLPPMAGIPKTLTGGMSATRENYNNGSTLEAIPEGQHIIRSKVISVMAMDEAAFHERPAESWNAALPAARGGGKITAITTPNGPLWPYRECETDRPWDEWRNWPELMTGVHSYRTSAGVQLVALHFTADEEQRTPEAQEDRRRGYTDVRAYARENELDFSSAAGLGVFVNEWSKGRHILSEFTPDPLLPIYRGWDFGYRGQAVCWAQIMANGQLVWFDQIILTAVPLARVIREVEARTARWIGTPEPITTPGRYTQISPQVIDVGDPSAMAHNVQGETVHNELLSHGIQLLTKATTGRKQDLVEQVRRLLLPRSDGKPGMLVARTVPEMEHVIAGFQGGYLYKAAREGQTDKEVPHKDGFYDHIFDGFQYLVDHAAPVRAGQRGDEPSPDWWMDKEVGVGNDFGQGVYSDNPWSET